MNLHQLSAFALAKPCVITAITAASNNGTGVDARGYSRATLLFYSAPSGTGTTSDCKLQDSTDNSSFSDVTSGTFAQVTTAGGTKLQIMEVDLSKRQRYIRAVHTGAGGSAAGQAMVVVMLHRGESMAPAQDNTVVYV